MSVFDDPVNVDRYEQWFRKHPAVFQSEVAAIRMLLPPGNGFEVGIGTGLFAEQLGIGAGNDVSGAMLSHARRRGRKVFECDAEHLSAGSNSFDFVVMVTTICFLGNPAAALRECRRILKPGGAVIIAFVDKESLLGERYRVRSGRSVFYGGATFYSVGEVRMLLSGAGFTVDAVRQTVFGEPDAISIPQDSRTGTGEGSFTVLRAVRT